MIRGTRLSTSLLLLLAGLAVSLALLTLSACVGKTPPPTPLAVIAPTATAVVHSGGAGSLSPELTRRAEDTFRQRDHMATLIAGRPTETPVPGEELNVPRPGLPSERGVWWYKAGSGDHTGRALLDRHPYGEALDLMDGRSGERYFPEIAEENRNLMLRGMVAEAVDLIAAADSDTAGFYDSVQLNTLLHNRMGRELAWEAASTEKAYVRVWTEFVWDSLDGPVTYRMGGMGEVGVLKPSPDDGRTQRYVGRVGQVPLFSGYLGTPVLERVTAE